MFHVHAWGFPYLATLLGAKQVYPGRYLAETILDLIEREGVTFSHGVPTVLHMLLNHSRSNEVDLRGWKLNTGGMALPRGLAQMAIDRGIKLFHGYGLSESCPVLTLANLKPHMLDWDEKRKLEYASKTGLPVPLVDLQLLDPTGSPVPADGKSSGEITVRAPWLTQSYFKSPALSERLWRGGRMHTGDIATQDEEGYLQITDRLKDAIKSGGEWISSLELESLLSQHPGVSEVAVVGVPDQKWGERPVAVVVPDPEFGERLSDELLRTHLQQFVDQGRIPPWAIPDRIRIMISLPKTSVGKIDKKMVRRDLAKWDDD
jgi:fatty-acyl-CoA synthase